MKCPNCGETVLFEEIVDTEYHGNECYNIGYGVCPKCDKVWKWTEVFTYARDEDIREIED